MAAKDTVLHHTRSVCPHCLAVLPAFLVQREQSVFLCRTCPQHGVIESVVWRGTPDFSLWKRPKKNTTQALRQTAVQHGCPHDCGLCPHHVQKSCSVLYELTDACNLHCPVCFASAGNGAENCAENTPPLSDEPLTLKTHKERLQWIASQAGQAVLQISGGEPTLSPYLLPLVREASQLFPAVQLNTNGLLLAEHPQLAVQLVEAGLSWVFLQCDGTSDSVYSALRGKPLWGKKQKALQNCKQAGLAVVLVPTVVRGVNEHELGNLVRFAAQNAPLVRGLHIQPMTRSGRNAFAKEEYTLTLPEVLHLLEEQTNGQIKPEHAVPPGCEHERCSFHCRYQITSEGALHPLREEGCCCREEETTEEGARKAISSVMRHWQKAEIFPASVPQDAFDAFITQSHKNSLSITCMAFQDAWTLDLERLQGCCIHVFMPPQRLVPFCACNLTSTQGVALYRKGEK